MECWDIYDINRQNTGKTMERGWDFGPDEYTSVMHICIFNSKGEMLIQQRLATKKTWPNLWDVSVGGHVTAGETSQMGASRELFEELGLKRDFSGIRPHFTINFVHGFDDYFFVEEDIDLKDLTLQKEEVQDVKWATRDEIKKMIENGEFITYYPSLIDFMFDSAKCYGAHLNESNKYLK